MRMQSTGSLVIDLSSACTAGACSAGASVSSRTCSASRISPSPMPMRPIARVRLEPPARNVTTPMISRIGAAADMSNDSTCTINVVPTLAPSMMASAGTSPTTPSAAERGGHQAGGGAALQQRRQAEAGAERGEAIAAAPCRAGGANRGRQARSTPLSTMCRPHSSSATPPIRSSRTRLPIGCRLHCRAGDKRWPALMRPSNRGRFGK